MARQELTCGELMTKTMKVGANDYSQLILVCSEPPEHEGTHYDDAFLQEWPT